MKKLLSFILALTMVLTMASFPAFAEDAAITPTGATSTIEGSGKPANTYDSDVTTYHQMNIEPGDGTAELASYTYTFDTVYTFSNISALWGATRAVGVEIYVSNNTSDWGDPVYSTTEGTFTTETAGTSTAYRAEYALTDATGKYVKVVITKTNQTAANWLTLREITFTGSVWVDPNPPVQIAISSASSNYTASGTRVLENTYDGDTKNTYFQTSTAIADAANPDFYLIYDLGAKYNLTQITYYAGGTYMQGATLYGSNTGTDGWTEIGTFSTSSLNWTTYLAADAGLDHEGYYRYVKIQSTKFNKAAQPVVREVIFMGRAEPEEEEPATTTYTVNYVDTEGNPVADAKTVTDKYVGDTVTETAVAVEGYTVDEETKSITLVDGTNTITFTYTAVVSGPVEVTPTNVEKTSNVVNFNNLLKAIDKDNTTYSQLKVACGDGTTEVGGWIFTFDGEYTFASINALWGSITPTGLNIYVSNDTSNWGTPVYSGILTYPSDFTKETVGTSSAYRAEYTLTEATGKYVLVAITKTNQTAENWATLREIAFTTAGTGEEPVEPTITPITLAPTGMSAPANTSGRPFSYATDGDTTTFYAVSGYHDPLASTNYQLVFDIGFLGTVDTLNLLWGTDGWGNTTPDAYKVEVSSDGKTWTQKKSYSGIYDITTGAATDTISGENTVFGITTSSWALTNQPTQVNAYTQGNVLEKNLGWTDVRYIRVTVTSVQYRLALREVTVSSTPNEDQIIIAKGGQIRIADADNEITAGLRFGAAIIKSTAGIAGDYVYSEDAEVKFGMFMLPKDMLGSNATLTAYLASGVQNALDVPAKNIYSQDDNFIIFTAVLTGIPESEYNTDIVAVPYMLKDGEYTYFDEMTKSYAGVAEAALETTYNPNVISAMADSEEKTALRQASYQLQYIQRGYDKPYTEQGERIIAKLKRGMNMQGLDASSWSSWDSHISTVTSSSTYQNIKNAGFDHVRIPVDFRNAADSSGNLDTSKMTTYVDKAVDAAIGQGLVVLLDFHGWADIMLEDFDYFVTVWTNLATYYKDKYPEDLIFELVNEPHSAEESNGDGGDLDMTNLVTLEKRTIEAIRAIDPDRFICLATAGWNGIWTLRDSGIDASDMFRNTGLMNYQDTIVALHSYTPMEFTHQDMSWAGTGGQTYSWSDNQEAYEAAIREELGYLVEFVEETGMHVVLNEFGCNTTSSVSNADEAAYAKAVVSCIKDNDKIAYTWWEYEQSFGMTSNGSWKTHILNEVMAE